MENKELGRLPSGYADERLCMWYLQNSVPPGMRILCTLSAADMPMLFLGNAARGTSEMQKLFSFHLQGLWIFGNEIP